MKGVVFLGNRRCEVREFPIPKPGRGEALLRIKATGICGSDLHVYRSEKATDQIRGHEPSGVVEAVGADVMRVKPGDRVTVHHHQGCGVCPACATGETVACPKDQVIGVAVPGSFSEFTVVKERNCISLPESVSFIDGAFMACVGGTAYGAYRRLGAVAHESVAVFGLGPVGLSCVLMGKAMGLRVIGVDVLPERMKAAAPCKPDAIVDVTKEDPVQAVRKFGRGGQGFWGDGVDYVIETSGATAARVNIIPSLRRGGKAAIVGVGGTEKVVNPSEIHGRACTLIGSVVFPLGWMWDLARFLATSGLTFEPAVTHRFPLDKAPEALKLADEGRCGKIIFLPHGEER
jgi:threonine dehydrogenase-like Zn-dependent dehydrogenase